MVTRLEKCRESLQRKQIELKIINPINKKFWMYSLTGSIEHRDASLVTWNKRPGMNHGRSQSNPNILITLRSCVNNIKALSSYKAFPLVEDIPLCFKHNVNIKLNMYSVWQNYLFILIFILLANSFGFNRPSSSQYLQKLTNARAYSITCEILVIIKTNNECDWDPIKCTSIFKFL
jgi:hypothetical protein